MYILHMYIHIYIYIYTYIDTYIHICPHVLTESFWQEMEEAAAKEISDLKSLWQQRLKVRSCMSSTKRAGVF